ncbi:MAG: DUF2203 domain-containing protein [Deltaproteobacteria bacterium]|nr:DUF2203 domain-containing protein [Deltaproteobacteria bacterium]
MEKIYFTFESANAMLPYLQDRLTLVQEIKSEMEEIMAQLEKKGVDLDLLFSAEHLPEEQQQIRQRLEDLGDQINDILEDIQDKGILVKDLQMGLVDFFAKVDGRDVFLCWKLGESEVAFWHDIDSGYSGRKSLFTREILEEVTTVH